MTNAVNWQPAFPLQPSSAAVDALCESWALLTSPSKPGFQARLKEPRLTRALKAYIENVTARKMGLLGMWTTEAVMNEIDIETAEVTSESRTDIVYGWNDETSAIQLVFEFKKLSAKKKSHVAYVGREGIGRFVDRRYSRGQPVAVMVGILLDTYDNIVPKLLGELSSNDNVTLLRTRRSQVGLAYSIPSSLFRRAAFDTCHDRDFQPEIVIAHLFLGF